MITIDLNICVLARGRRLRETREHVLTEENDRLSSVARESMIKSMISSGKLLGKGTMDVDVDELDSLETEHFAPT